VRGEMMVAMWMTRKYLIRSTKVDERTQKAIMTKEDVTSSQVDQVIISVQF